MFQIGREYIPGYEVFGWSPEAGQSITDKLQRIDRALSGIREAVEPIEKLLKSKCEIEEIEPIKNIYTDINRIARDINRITVDTHYAEAELNKLKQQLAPLIKVNELINELKNIKEMIKLNPHNEVDIPYFVKFLNFIKHHGFRLLNPTSVFDILKFEYNQEVVKQQEHAIKLTDNVNYIDSEFNKIKQKLTYAIDKITNIKEIDSMIGSCIRYIKWKTYEIKQLIESIKKDIAEQNEEIIKIKEEIKVVFVNKIMNIANNISNHELNIVKQQLAPLLSVKSHFFNKLDNDVSQIISDIKHFNHELDQIKRQLDSS